MSDDEEVLAFVEQAFHTCAKMLYEQSSGAESASKRSRLEAACWE